MLNPHETQRRQLVRAAIFRLSTTIGFLLDSGNEEIQALIQAAVAKGDLRPLAEPNLLTLPAKEAYFLAGGEFPYPTVQSGQSNAVTITVQGVRGPAPVHTPDRKKRSHRRRWRPGVHARRRRDRFRPRSFLRTRRAETEVELREGQHLAIAGLLDNESTKNLTKIPILGDIPIPVSSSSPAPASAGPSWW